ncbi:response regulator [Streptomyces sp. NPDC051219]|uniref:response regulator n=1 Tax=Streptomyces sp. NPDC051219 TaxID=3155283 RepID=UPI0034484299
MPDETSPAPGQHSVSSHVSQHTSSHTAPLHSDPTPTPAPASTPFPDPFSQAPLRVVVADDNPVVRAGLTVLLGGRDDIQVVAEAADGREALRITEQLRPDVVLLDVRMPGVDGISALPYLVQVAPVMMLTYSRESEIVREALRLGAGGYLVHGEFTADQLVGAVRDVREGRAHFTATAASALLAQVRDGGTQHQQLPDGLGQQGATAHGVPPQPLPGRHQGPPQQAAPHESTLFNPSQNTSQTQPGMGQSSEQHRNNTDFGLSSREAEVMDLIASGMNNQQIAATCFISEKTVKNHINRIFAKLHSTSRSEAIAMWLGTVHSTGGAGTGHGRGFGGHG